MKIKIKSTCIFIDVGNAFFVCDFNFCFMKRNKYNNFIQPIVTSKTMFAGFYKRFFRSDRENPNSLTTTTCELNGDSLLMCKKRAKQDIQTLKTDIERQRSAAMEAKEAAAQQKTPADRDVEKENCWLVSRLCTSEKENRWLMERLRIMRIENRKLHGELRESEDENLRLRNSNSELEKQEAERAMRLRILEEKCDILSSVTTEVRTLINLNK